MSRIEKNQPATVEATEQKKRRMSWRTWVVLFVFFVIFAIIAFVTWTLAATGLVNVPIISGWAYAVPSPSRVVEEGIPFETVVGQQALSSFLSIPETTLTTELRDSLETSGQTFVEADRSQVVVIADSGIELFLPLRDNAQDTAIVVRLRLSVVDGTPTATAEAVSVGSWKLGGWLRAGIVNPALGAILDAAVREMKGSVVVSSVREGDGVLLVNVANP